MTDNIFILVWDTLIAHPMVNTLAGLYTLLWDNFGLAIIAFTIIIRLLTLPLQIKQTRATGKLGKLQTELKAIRQKYSGPDPKGVKAKKRKIAEKHAVKANGINPLGCLGPLILQIPIWIGLFTAIRLALPDPTIGHTDLLNALYTWNPAIADLPFNPTFLTINLAANTSAAGWLGAILSALVGITLYLQQKVTSVRTYADENQRKAGRLILWLLPIAFGFLSWQFPAGLALYILTSNTIGVITQYILKRRTQKHLTQ